MEKGDDNPQLPLELWELIGLHGGILTLLSLIQTCKYLNSLDVDSAWKFYLSLFYPTLLKSIEASNATVNYKYHFKRKFTGGVKSLAAKFQKPDESPSLPSMLPITIRTYGTTPQYWGGYSRRIQRVCHIGPPLWSNPSPLHMHPRFQR